MKNLYEIGYETKNVINGKNSRWSRGDEKLHVLANGNMEKAIRKAKRHLLAHRYTFYEDGVRLVEKCVAVRITSASVIASVDVS